MITTPIEAAPALATAAVLPMTAVGAETLTLVWDLARIARHDTGVALAATHVALALC